MECSIRQMSNNRQSAAAENSRPGVEKAPCLLNKRNRMPLVDILFFYLAEKGGAEKGGFENYEICVYATHKAARTIMECSITQMSNNRQSAAAENSQPGVEKAPCLLNKRNRMPLADILFFYLAEKGGFEPPVPLRVRQFSKLLVSATHPSLLRRKWLA